MEIKITKFTHFFKVSEPDPILQEKLTEFVKQYLVEPKLDYKDGRYIKVPGKVFATRTRDKREYRIHINCLELFTSFFQNRNIQVIVEKDEAEEVYPGDDAEFIKPPGFQLRDYQEEANKFLFEEACTRVIELAPGKGKTSLSLWFISEYRKKVCIFVLGRYTERWWSDIGDWVEKDAILEIRGSLELEDVLRNSENPAVRNTKMFVMTITTFSDYCAKWENGSFEDRQGMVPPEMVWEVLGVGIRVTDETHQHFHQNFLTDLYTHIPKAVYLSATLNPGDAFLKRMYETFLPLKDRFGAGLQEKYTRVYAMFYRFNKPNKIRCQNRKRMYNHTEFEKWLMRDPKLLLNYFGMIDEYVEEKYLSVRKDKQKLLIFFGTKLMCEKYAKHLKMKWPNIDSRKYVSEDKYENLLQADIACSTLGSSGTAVDIPNLLRCLMTTALKSEQANLQALGRLRKLNDETEFTYLVCTDIPKHLEYHEAKKRLFRDWVKSQQIYFTEKSI